MTKTPQEIYLNRSLTQLRGISDKRAIMLRKLGLATINDLVYYFPRDYEDRRNIVEIGQLELGQRATIVGKILSYNALTVRKNLTIINVLVEDETGTLIVRFYNQRYLKDSLIKGKTFLFHGLLQVSYREAVMESPSYAAYEKLDEFAIVVPKYPLTKGISQYMMQNLIRNALSGLDHVKDRIPQPIIDKYKLIDKDTAIRTMHFPDDGITWQKSRNRLAFEELLNVQILLHSIKEKSISSVYGIVFEKNSLTKNFISSLPYKLTEAQKRVWAEIEEDMAKRRPMNRLVIGDVGSGKTIIAVLAMINAIKAGYQALYMAPTEILADQHSKTVSSFLEPLGIKTGLLTGSLTAKDKRQVLEDIKEGKIQAIVGTHALIQKDVHYDNVGLVITDEQHRFGVRQRADLAAKGKTPDILVMTATPIPRTLALILYGDIDISTIDQLPLGRIPIKTYAVDDSLRTRAYNFAKKKVKENQQVYIVHPMVEDSETMNLISAKENFEKLSKTVFRNIETGLIHGKMRAREKEDTMRAFVDGKIKILFSTTVIEVGLDVPNASLMIIENADRFGLSQLHQLRGRVGRSKLQSHCILITDNKSDLVRERMKILVETTDGLKISEKDLELRGPGDFFGTLQHGLPDFKVANLYEDLDILKLAQAAALTIMKEKESPSYKDYIRLVVKRMEGHLSI